MRDKSHTDVVAIIVIADANDCAELFNGAKRSIAQWSRTTDMVAHTHAPELAEFPPELIAAVRAQAELDADAAADFVRLSVQAAGNTTLKLDVDQFDPAAMIGFGLVVRFRRWELQHIRVHIDAGLPCSADMLLRMVKLGRGRKLARFVAWVMIASTTVFHDSFLWSGDDSDHCLDLAIVGSSEDDLFLNAITQFLLDHIRKDVSQGSY